MATDEKPKMLIVMALKEESQGLIETQAEKQGISVFYTGVGLLKAAEKLTSLIHQLKPQKILNLGTAGSKKIPVGELVEVTEYIFRGEHFLDINFTIQDNPHTNLKSVSCGSADHVDFSENTVYDIMDMEAYALARVCKSQKVDFMCVKYISDSSNINLKTEWQNNLKKSAFALADFLVQHKF